MINWTTLKRSFYFPLFALLTFAFSVSALALQPSARCKGEMDCGCTKKENGKDVPVCYPRELKCTRDDPGCAERACQKWCAEAAKSSSVLDQWLMGADMYESAPTKIELAQAAGAGADFNKADREKVRQRELQECRKTCDSIAKSNSMVCGGFGLQAAATCNLNVQKQSAACYVDCGK